MLTKIANFLNSPLSLLIFGFLGTTVLGGYMNNAYHEQSWKSKARFEVFKEHLSESKKFEKELLLLSSKRFALLERVHFELASDRLKSARQVWKEYFVVVKEWNHAVKSNRNRVSLLFGEDVALSFLSDDESNAEKPLSLHHQFRKAHYAVLSTLKCMKKECEPSLRRGMLDDARNKLNMLGITHDEFSRDLRRAIVIKHNNLISSNT